LESSESLLSHIARLTRERDALSALCDSLAPENVIKGAQAMGLEISQLRAQLEEAKRIKVQQADHALELMKERDEALRQVERLKALKDKAADIAIAIALAHNEHLKERDRYKAALEQIKDTPGLGGLDHTSTKAWRESSMRIIDKIAHEALSPKEET
jgi:hypothetical protein